MMTDRTLFDGDDEPAILTGYGPIPAPLARRLVRDANPDTKTWIRRLYTDPDTGHLINADSRRRTFPHASGNSSRPRPDLPHPLVRRPDPAHRPHHLPRRRRTHHHHQRPRHLRSLQLHQRSRRLAPPHEPDGTAITITTPTGHTTRSEPPPPPQSIHWIEQSVIEERLYRWLLAS